VGIHAALAVGIFDAQQKAPARSAGEQLVEQRRARISEVQLAGRARRKAGDHGRSCLR
jgi:hypothetical protein